MTKRIAIFIAAVLVTITLLSLFNDHHEMTILIGGKEIHWPMEEAVNIGGIIVALIALIGLAILMALALASVWVIGFGILIMGCVIFTVVMFPFLLPLFILLGLVWLFIVLVNQKI